MADDIIVVEAKLPPTPLVLADAAFLVALVQTEHRVAALEVKDDASAQVAANILREITRAGTELEKARRELKQPFIEVGRLIDDTARKTSRRIDAIKGVVKGRLADYAEIQAAKAAEERRRREEELRKLEEQQQREQAEAERRAREIAEQARTPIEEVDLDFDAPVPVEKTEVEQKIERLRYAPQITRPAAPSGVTFKTVLKFEVEDVNALPSDFVIRTPNERLIRETFCIGYKEGMPAPSVPGIRFTVEKQPVSTGR